MTIYETVLKRLNEKYPDEEDDNVDFLLSQLGDRQVRASDKALMLRYLNNTLPHWNQGGCPDPTQPASVDSMCVACEVMVRLRAFVKANYHEQ